jgi:hypothetical protein
VWLDAEVEFLAQGVVRLSCANPRRWRQRID